MSSAPQNVAARRSTRMHTDILIEVQGENFAYAGQTLTVNVHGALIRIAAPLKLGDPIIVHVQNTGKSASARVVFLDANASAFGVEFENPGNIWGVAEPPEDWVESSFQTA